MDRTELESILVPEITAVVGSRLASAYLFGSEAERRPHRESDVDIAVLLDPSDHGDRRSRFDMRILLASRLISRLGGRAVDIVVLDDAPPLLARRIVLDGVRLLCPRPDVDRDFALRIQLRAADIDPFLRRMRTIKLASLGPP